ncbi:MAG: LysR family transcriptional regulator [Bdellovibrionales bacterium]|nr:LysR family transcriptional regulator [Bdellovibrionales bacterium]
MFIDSLNLNQVRIFECVYRTQSMTAAARELHLTQSGVSQHIRAFEDMLGAKLFDRINQRVVPTASAAMLYENCKKSLTGLEDAFAELQAEKNQLAGRVHVGMPTEFGYNVVIPAVAKFTEKHPGVRFHFRLGYGAEMNALLLRGEIDFAFIDEFAMDKKVKTAPIYDEVLELVAAPDFVKKAGGGSQNREYFESLRYVDFSKDEQILRRWFSHHFGDDAWRLPVRSTIEDSQGVARLVIAGVGAGILPGHLVRKLEREGTKLHTYKGKGSPLKNTVSIAQLRERSHTRSVQTALEFLTKEIEGASKAKKN